MKRIWITLALLGAMVFAGCEGFDPADIWEFIDDMSNRTSLQIEVITTGNIDITPGSHGTVHFRVNPSTAQIPTGSSEIIGKWFLDLIATRSYINTTTEFLLYSILPDGDKQGQYIATITRDNSGAAGEADEFVMSLVLNTGSVTNPKLVSSSPFVVGKKTDNGGPNPPGGLRKADPHKPAEATQINQITRILEFPAYEELYDKTTMGPWVALATMSTYDTMTPAEKKEYDDFHLFHFFRGIVGLGDIITPGDVIDLLSMNIGNRLDGKDPMAVNLQEVTVGKVTGEVFQVFSGPGEGWNEPDKTLSISSTDVSATSIENSVTTSIGISLGYSGTGISASRTKTSTETATKAKGLTITNSYNLTEFEQDKLYRIVLMGDYTIYEYNFGWNLPPTASFLKKKIQAVVIDQSSLQIKLVQKPKP